MDIKKGKIVYPKVPTEKKVEEIDYEQLTTKPSFISKSISVDLSGSATTEVCLHTELEAELVRAFLLYTEASSSDAGVGIRVGKESDNDYYYSGTSEASKAIYYTKDLTLLKKDIAKGDTVTLYSAGGKTGTGEVLLYIEYKLKGSYRGQ